MLEVLGSSDEILPQLATELQQSGPEPEAPQEPFSSSTGQQRAPAEEQPAQLQGSDSVGSAALHSNGDQAQLKAGAETKGAGPLQTSAGGSVCPQRLPAQSGCNLPGRALQDLDSPGGDVPRSNGVHQQQGESAGTLQSVFAFGGFSGNVVFSATCMSCRELTKTGASATTAV